MNCVLLVYTSLLWTLVGGAIHQKDVNHWVISPKDNCKPVCPCIMDGINYEHGEKWQRKDQPCTTYECQNGYYEAVYRGCEYKGKCKDSGSTWTEGCFTYKCFTSEIWAYYRLIQGGCEDSQGNCWKVGETVNRNCHRYECQIVGSGCYKLIIKSAGCEYQGTCKTFNSYWHNGCSIFQCVNNSNIISYERLTDEVMFWPDGDYALMKPKFGCPRDKPSEWSEGRRYHCGNNKNDISNPFDLFGNYTKLCFDQYFCVHKEIKDLSYIPRYQTFWEPGQYCILRKGGKCPEGFKDGYVGLDDLLGLEIMAVSNGSLPDGNYTKDTGFFFCCRNDSYATAPIVLPKDDAFALFMVNGSNQCQEVRGMTYEVQYFAFDDDDHFTEIYQNGSIPLIMREDGITVFYYCIYKPLDCGCRISNGDFLKVGEKTVKDCTEYQCRESQGMRYLEIIRGGCLLPDGTCKNENDSWVETSGETCHAKSCLRDTESDDITFKITTDFVGCRDEDKCLSVGSSKKRGCYDLRCVFPYRGGNPRFRLLKAGCSDGNGGCIPLGKTFQRGCITYRCRREPSKCELEFVKGACKYNHICREVNETWTSKSCNKLTCTMSMRKKSYLFSTEVSEYGCSYNGKCYKEGANVTDGCFTKQCTLNVEKKYVYMDIVNGGCMLNGKCLAVNSTFEKDCNTFRCFWRRQNRKHSFGVEVANYGCKYGGKCYVIGDVMEKNCISYVCSLTEKNGHKYAAMQSSSRACQDGKGGCVQLGTELQDDKCFHMKCSMVGNWPIMKIVKGGKLTANKCAFPDSHFVGGTFAYHLDHSLIYTTKGTKRTELNGCMYNGTCYDEGNSWTRPSDCVTYKCNVEKRGNTYKSTYKIIDIGCSDAGPPKRCRSHNETWTEGCYEKRCLITHDRSKMFSRVESKPRGCMINGVCREVGYKMYYHGCHQYKCIYDEKIKQARFSFHSGGCSMGDKCLSEGEIFERKCVAYRCTVTQIHGKVRAQLKMDLGNSSCKDRNGECIRVGETILEESSCFYRQCKATGNRLGFHYVKGGCRVNGVCRDGGAKWTNENGCVTYQCDSKRNGRYFSSRIKIVDVSCCCRSNSKNCKRKNEEWIEGCYKKTCHIQKTGEKFSTRISMKPNGCRIKGQCRPVGYTEYRNGCFLYGCLFDTKSQMARFQYVKGGCRDSNSQCHDPGESWNHKYGNSCFKATCQKRGNSYGTKFTHQHKSYCM